MDVDLVMVDEDQVIVLVDEDQVIVLVDIIETHQQETNTEKDEIHAQVMADKVEIAEKSGRYNT